MDPKNSRAATTAACRQLYQVAGYRDLRRRKADKTAQRRQPAKGRSGALAGLATAPVDPRRTDPRHRRWRQGGNRATDRAAVRGRDGDSVHFVGTGGSRARQPSGRGVARPENDEIQTSNDETRKKSE